MVKVLEVVKDWEAVKDLEVVKVFEVDMIPQLDGGEDIESESDSGEENTGEKTKKKVKKVECSICQRKFVSNFTLKRHQEILHQEVFIISNEEESGFMVHSIFNNQPEALKPEKPLVCPQCPSGFTRLDSMLRHMVKKHHIKKGRSYIPNCQN